MVNQTSTHSAPNRWRTDQTGGSKQPLNARPQPASEQRFATVSLPDLRVQNIASLTGCRTESTKQRSSDLQAVAARLRTASNPNAKTSSFLNDFETPDPQLHPLIDSILEYYPPSATTIIMLAGSEWNPMLDITVAGISVAIQQRTDANVLLIDSDFDSGSLSGRLDCTDQFGLADLADDQQSWKQALRPTSKPKIDFMSIGTGPIESVAQLRGLLKANLPNISAGYRHIFVNGGDAHGIAATSWSQHVNGTYLLVSQDRSNQIIAKSAVSQLTNFGARLLGCIVSDVRS